jgi:hypothetical protein
MSEFGLRQAQERLLFFFHDALPQEHDDFVASPTIKAE